MKQKLMPRWWLIKLTGLLFALYSAYNVFIIVRDGSTLPSLGIFISALVALLFGLLAVFAWTSEVKNIRFLMIRKTAAIFVFLTLFALKLRMVGKVFSSLDIKSLLMTLYACSYSMTLAALFLLFVYYAFILRNLPAHPKAAVALPVSIIFLCVGSFVLEVIIFFVFGIGLEANPLRTMIIRPVFYLGLVGLSAYFLLPSPYVIEDDDFF